MPASKSARFCLLAETAILSTSFFCKENSKFFIFLSKEEIAHKKNARISSITPM